MQATKVAIASTALVMLGAVACTGSNSTNGASGIAPLKIASDGLPYLGMDATRTAPAKPIPGAKSGGTLTVLSSEDLGGSMDPTQVYSPLTGSIETALVVRSLTQFVYDPKTKQMVLIPDLATDLGQPNFNFTSWKYTLRPGLKFENGRPVTAEDMKFGIERSFAGGPPWSNEYFLHGHTYQGPYKTPGPYNGVTVKGNTITIHMARPFPDMPYWGSFPAMSPIPPGKASDPATYMNHPWATGPYMFKDGGFDPEKSLVLVKNPYWDPATDPGRHQYVDEFDFRFGIDPDTINRVMLSDTGTGQTTLSYDNILPSDYQTFAQTAGDRLVLGPAQCTHYFAPDNRKITDIRVRRALAFAYPYRADWISQDLIPGVTALPASNIMPPGITGRVAYNPIPGHTPGQTDAAKATALLTAAGKLGYTIRWEYQSDDPYSAAEALVVARALREAGFDPQPEPVKSADFATATGPKGDVNLRYGGWCSDWPTGSSWLPPFFQSRDIADPNIGLGSNAAAFFSSKAVDDRINAISRLLITAQPAAWNALDRLIQTKYFPVVVTYYDGVAMMRGSKVHNDFVDASGLPTWKDIWLG